MTRLLFSTIIVALSVLVQQAAADSYEDFTDFLEVDRTGSFFADVRRNDGTSLEKGIAIRVWTRLRPEVDRTRVMEFDSVRRAPSLLTPGHTQTVFEGKYPFHPNLVRISPEAIAFLDYHGINYSELNRGPAIHVVRFDHEQQLSFQLDDVFEGGIRRYHNGRGRVNWLRDAWFIDSATRLLVVSEENVANSLGFEVAIISLTDSSIKVANSKEIINQLARVEDRFLHVVLEVATKYSIDELDERALSLFDSDTCPVAAKVRAAAHLRKLGNKRAEQLLRELAALRSLNLTEVRHPLLSSSEIADPYYWWNTIGYAARIYDLDNSVDLRLEHDHR